MYILVAAATPFEIAPLMAGLEQSGVVMGKHEVVTLVTGIGSLAASWSLSQAINSRIPDFMIQAGIAGSLNANLFTSQVVIVSTEIQGDLGAWENDEFLDIFDLGLAKASAFPFSDKELANPLVADKKACYGIPTARGVTVNEITTRAEKIALLKQYYQAETESMEGAAFHYAGLMANIPFLQLRAISNIVGDRNKKNWKIKEAIGELNEQLITLLPQL
ncbi:MAG: futalosine hydrolase [Chitinophagaceae bacterium]|nr:futalosine hydrolase [Chitinophagaceae bacterium]